jgi:hypothetical protein
MGGRNARSVSKEKGNAAIQIKCLCMAHSRWVVATMQHPRGGKIMTSKRRKPPNQRSCFLFRIEGYGSCRHVRQPSVSHDAISTEQTTAWRVAVNFNAKQFFADRTPPSTGLLRRAAETDRGVASLLCAAEKRRWCDFTRPSTRMTNRSSGRAAPRSLYHRA